MTVSRLQASHYSGDGLLDLLLGGMLLLGALLLFEGAALAIVFLPLMVVAVQRLKQNVTAPRLHDDEVADEATTGAAQRWLPFITIGVLAVAVLVFMATDPYQGAVSWPALAVVLAVIVGGAGVVMAVRSHDLHFYAYAVLAALMVYAVWAQGLDLRIALASWGAAAVAYGAYEMVTFLRHHPRLIRS